MPLKLNVTGDAQTVNLDFNQAAGLKALDVKNKFIGIDTSTKAFQDIFKGYPSSAFRDEIIGDAKVNIIHAGDGDDVVNARDGNDIIFGEGGKDSLSGENGDDFLVGGTDADLLQGGEGDDYLYGEAGDDNLYGQAGDNSLYGGTGDDYLRAGDGNDNLYGGTGEDTLYGGSGRDMFVLASESGSDTIFNFTVGSDYLGLLNGLTF
ncbi:MULTISPECIES: calcium-binding protein [unclassified Nostoc]|nr:calcium-binding protein [Nostoc sp. S13]MDF5734254.1 calcium-binding protein [Nostoc sp. S13]